MRKKYIGRDNVEGPFYLYSDRSMYDIRRMSYEPPYEGFFVKWLNLAETQRALGVQVSFMYEESSHDVYSAFQQSGDYVYPGFKEDLEFLLHVGITVLYGPLPYRGRRNKLRRTHTNSLISKHSLIYGDADYIGNWYLPFIPRH
jgi:hypothetical protein